ncbi:uncharacterized protein LOC132698062 isoform X2 [Cylas formicarius]|uniref:uncharacterized protein LOC132698062 isoform X2 n=1 Tax=Cylas formicarius TaxID=197179 RepID=UPI002958822E|nr:uncharacterized protein LOC132698062 isoform X2 [Cylas formicarius]
MRSYFYGVLLISCWLVVDAAGRNGKKKTDDVSDENLDSKSVVGARHNAGCTAKKCAGDRSVKNESDDETMTRNRYKMDKQTKYDTLNKANKFIKTAKVENERKKGGNGNKDSDESGGSCDSSVEDCGSSEEDFDRKKFRGKIKYSIKFQHEKKKTPSKMDSSILRLHKNRGRDRNTRDDDSSEEDDNPFPKRIRFDEDDDD